MSADTKPEAGVEEPEYQPKHRRARRTLWQRIFRRKPDA